MFFVRLLSFFVFLFFPLQRLMSQGVSSKASSPSDFEFSMSFKF